MIVKTISEELKQQYSRKIYRLALSSGCTCPNRDGNLGFGGCTFCSAGGSGDFATSLAPLDQQISEAKQRILQKMPKGTDPMTPSFIAYFQSFTGTYARNADELVRLELLYTEAILRPDIVILSIATRPDCVGPDVIAMLQRVQQHAPEKPIWIELGLQTIHEDTALMIHRGYKTGVFSAAYQRLTTAGFSVIVHVILGLPGESEEAMLETVRFLARLSPTLFGIKLQLLHVLHGTELAAMYNESPFPLPDLEEYCDLVVRCLQELPANTIIHRMTGDGPRSLLIAPLWSTDKKRVLNTLKKKIVLADDRRPES